MEPRTLHISFGDQDDYAANLARMTPAIHGLALTFQHLAFPETFIHPTTLPFPLYLRQAMTMVNHPQVAVSELLRWVDRAIPPAFRS
jgi:hypothetical protein